MSLLAQHYAALEGLNDVIRIFKWLTDDGGHPFPELLLQLGVALGLQLEMNLEGGGALKLQKNTIVNL